MLQYQGKVITLSEYSERDGAGEGSRRPNDHKAASIYRFSAMMVK